jgi:hypothetical protein
VKEEREKGKKKPRKTSLFYREEFSEKSTCPWRDKKKKGRR